jgi:hypothetical protein
MAEPFWSHPINALGAGRVFLPALMMPGILTRKGMWINALSVYIVSRKVFRRHVWLFALQNASISATRMIREAKYRKS